MDPRNLLDFCMSRFLFLYPAYYTFSIYIQGSSCGILTPFTLHPRPKLRNFSGWNTFTPYLKGPSCGTQKQESAHAKIEEVLGVHFQNPSENKKKVFGGKQSIEIRSV